jgi:hypothetical protein
MEWEGKVSAATTICAASGEPLAPGSACISALVQEADGTFARRDFAPAGWASQDQGRFLSWWKRVVPQPGKKAFKLDADLLRKLFIDLRDSDDARRRALGYVCCLALIRLKSLRLVRIAREGGRSWMVLEERGGAGGQLRIEDPRLSAEDEAAITEELMQVIGAP